MDLRSFVLAMAAVLALMVLGLRAAARQEVVEAHRAGVGRG